MGLGDEPVGVRVVQAVYACVVIVVGVGMPVAAIWAGGDIDTVWHTAVDGAGLAQERATLTLLGRGIQTVFIVTVTLLPGLLFFLFNRYRLSTLEDEFTRQIFRLDRSIRTRGALNAKYGHLMDEAYGRHSRQHGRSRRHQPGTRLPVIIATVIFALGWIVVLLNAEVEVVLVRDGLRSLLAPWQSPTAFAFLGAYVFLLQAALRAYLPRGSEAEVLQLCGPPRDRRGRLRLGLGSHGPFGRHDRASGDGLRGRPRSRHLPAPAARVSSQHRDQLLVEKHPLTELEGVDIYDRTRLEQEGVTNVEALAHSNLVELMLQTRIPTGRLVDWTDQAQLYLHLPKGKENGEDGGAEDCRSKLQANGIRTASDLILASRAKHNGKTDDRGGLDALTATLGSTNGGPPMLQTVVDAIEDEEWARQILDWHLPHREHTLLFPQDFDFGTGVIPRP